MTSAFARIVFSWAASCLLLALEPGTCAAQNLGPLRDSIPGTLITWEMVPVPAGAVTVESASGARTVNVAPFYIGRTEVTWDMYDVYMLRLDQDRANATADAVARPSMPYAVPDYEWGHAGYAAISIAHGAAQAFCQWLSARTGHEYRLATEVEWIRAATLAAGPEPLNRARIDALAWHRDNAGRKTHPIASKQADALGLFDLFGNVAEWVISDTTQTGGRQVTRGGSFRDEAGTLGPNARAVQNETWTERDPQLPKSVWWLSDGPFVGFRLVRDP